MAQRVVKKLLRHLSWNSKSHRLFEFPPHSISSLYQAFPADQAHRLANRLEIHHTPKHGSWLNTAEIELSAYKRQCLNRRIPTIEQLVQETEMWTRDRNNSANKVNWQFTTKDVRIKLKRLYPQV